MSWLLSPLAWMFLAALLAPVAWLARSRWLAAGCLAIAGAAFAAMTPIVANALLARLEKPIAGAADCRALPPDTVVILAGGVDRPPRSGVDFSVMNLASMRRMERGVQYWRGQGNRQMIVVGGAVVPGVANADLMAAYAQWLGVAGPALRIERRSGNTHENARNVAALVPRTPRRIALVTSAMHMPRAGLAFRSAGFQICPLPTDFRRVPVAPPGGLLPRTSSLVKTEAALHEMAGTVYYLWQLRRTKSRAVAADDAAQASP